MKLWLIALGWWFLFYQGANGGWARYGPFIQQDTCERTAQHFIAAGIAARCVEILS